MEMCSPHSQLAPPKPAQSWGASERLTPSVNTRIVNIICSSPDPQFAAAFANALVNEYIDSDLKARWDAINNARQWLAQQLEKVRAKLQQSETNLQDYGAASHLLFTGDKESAEQDKLKEMQTALFAAQAERIAKQSQYQIAMSTTADSVPQVIDSAQLSDYQTKLADLRRRILPTSARNTHRNTRRCAASRPKLTTSKSRSRRNGPTSSLELRMSISRRWSKSACSAALIRNRCGWLASRLKPRTNTTSWNAMWRPTARCMIPIAAEIARGGYGHSNARKQCANCGSGGTPVGPVEAEFFVEHANRGDWRAVGWARPHDNPGKPGFAASRNPETLPRI